MNRLLEIDAIRGLAALGIVLFHYASSHQWTGYHPYQYFHYLEECVQVFFIISGFVILISITRLSRSFDFIVGRFARLYPIYLISVITTILITNVARIAQPRTENIYDIIGNFLIFHGLLGEKSVNIVYWTLTLEICFYVIMLLIYRLKLVKHIDLICGIWAFIVLVDTIKGYTSADVGNLSLVAMNQPNQLEFVSANQLGVAAFSNQPLNLVNIVISLKEWIKINFLLLQGRAVLFIAGIMLYQCKTWGFSLYRIGIILLCILTKAFDYIPDTPWYSFLFFAFFVIMIYLVITDKLRSLSIRPLVFLGTISYSLYLIHLQVNWLIAPLFANLPIELSIIIKACIAIAVAGLLTYTIELPALEFIKSQYKKNLVKG
ncbi:MAG TPA: acyltransferase [Nostocaceae cyanobacterium]|nr:acyltransferase [Nostocaceae cyanobacterium]